MTEFHVQSYADREKVVMGLANSGYKVSVVERPDPKRYLGVLYYIQVEEPKDNITLVIQKADVNSKELFEKISEAMQQNGVAKF